MDLLQVIQFEGNVDDLVWKSPVEDFNTSSILICDETHEALVLVNGVQYGIYSAGRHVLETPNIPIAKKLINIPTDGKTSFPCKVFFVNKLHQMSMNWGIPGSIALEDPIYHVFLHIGAHGGANFYVNHTAKFLEKLVGFRNVFDPRELTDPDHGMFRSMINKYVVSDLSKIMISGNISYFTIAENLYEISDVLKEQLNEVFDDYGIALKEFVIEGVTTKEEDYAEVKAAKSKYMSRKLQGYTWQEEANVDILRTFAGNTGAAGGIGGAMGGFMVGGAIGGSLADLARGVLNGNAGPSTTGPSISGGSGVDVQGFLKNFNNQQQGTNPLGAIQGQTATAQQDPLSGQQFAQQDPMGGQQFTQQQNSMGGQQVPPQDSMGGQQFTQQQNSMGGQQVPPQDPMGGQQFTQQNPQGGYDPYGTPVVPPQTPVQPEPQQPVCVCSNCGTTYTKQVKFCTRCGNPMAEPVQKRFCPECGNELGPDDLFCGNCGHRF